MRPLKQYGHKIQNWPIDRPAGTTAAGPVLHDNGVLVSLAVNYSVPVVHLLQGPFRNSTLG